MWKNLSILLAAAGMVALPFLLRPATPDAPAGPAAGAQTLVIISPHNEAIRYEFGRAFERWHRETYGEPVRVEWISIGGTTEIARYLTAEYVAAVRAWWRRQGQPWTPGSAEVLLDPRAADALPPDPEPLPGEDAQACATRVREEEERYTLHRPLARAFRETDDAAAFSCRVDLFFGGGQFDHDRARRQGLTVPPWPAGDAPEGLLRTPDGRTLIPESLGGEIWRSDTYFGSAVSTFGIGHNPDLLADLGIPHPPERWEDLADFAYYRRLGVADPTKSGSIAKAFEMIVQEQCRQAVGRAGFSEQDIDRFESAPGGDALPEAYTHALAEGWKDGVNLLRRIGANARYFTDSAGQVPIDVSLGRAAAGLAIDFFARYQAEHSRGPRGEERLRYVTPTGGSSVSADPISLLRGAPRRELAVRFIEFTLREEGQRLWTYRPGTPGGPERFALRRLPIRRDFYPSDDPEFQAAHERHLRHAAEDLADPAIDPYQLAHHFVYRGRWTGRHFGVHRDLVRAMCLDSSVELQRAWAAIHRAGGPGAVPEAIARFDALPDRPEPLTWQSAPGILRTHERLDVLREWTAFFRAQYREATRLAEAGR